MAKKRAPNKGRREVIATPWWKVRQNWIAIGILLVILVAMGFLAVGGNIGSGTTGALRGVGL